MIVTLNKKKSYLDVKKINGMIFEQSMDDKYPSTVVIFFEASQMTFIIPCDNKEEAFEIMEAIEKSKQETLQTKKEIENFKEALEYAIKIVKGE